MHLGQFGSAMEHFERALLLYDPERHRDDAFLYAQNPGVAMRCFAAWSRWVLGQSDQALEPMKEALDLARELSEPHGLAHALFFAATLHQLRREAESALRLAEEAIAISAEHGLVLYQAMATIIRGWAVIERERHHASIDGVQREVLIDEISRGIADHRATGAEVLCPHFLALLVESLSGSGQTERQLSLLDEALSLADRTGEKFYQAELYRLKGDALLIRARDSRRETISLAATGGGAVLESESGISAQAEACFHESLKIARRQGAKSWELRAAVSLARFYKERSGREEANKSEDVIRLLTQIHACFSEGTDTMDLREARDLLTDA